MPLSLRSCSACQTASSTSLLAIKSRLMAARKWLISDTRFTCDNSNMPIVKMHTDNEPNRMNILRRDVVVVAAWPPLQRWPRCAAISGGIVACGTAVASMLSLMTAVLIVSAFFVWRDEPNIWFHTFNTIFGWMWGCFCCCCCVLSRWFNLFFSVRNFSSDFLIDAPQIARPLQYRFLMNALLLLSH